jgi:hypothetical protein
LRTSNAGTITAKRIANPSGNWGTLVVEERGFKTNAASLQPSTPFVALIVIGKFVVEEID